MSVAKVSAITVAPADQAEFARRYRTTPEDAPEAEGLLGFEVLVPDDGRNVCLIVTRWTSADHFAAWTQSADFAARHARHQEGGPIDAGSEIWGFSVVE